MPAQIAVNLQLVLHQVGERWTSADTPIRVVTNHHERLVFVAINSVGRRVVIKTDTDTRRLCREADTLRAAAAAGVPVPEVLEFTEAFPATLVMTHVDGEPLWEAGDNCWLDVGRQLRRLHRDVVPPTSVPMFGGGDLWWSHLRSWALAERDVCLARGSLLTIIVDRLYKLLAAAFARNDEPPRRLLHGDCAPYHWLCRDGDVVGVIDFGDVALGDPAWDLVVLTRWDREFLTDVLAGYEADERLRAHTEAMYVPYSVMRCLAAMSWLVEHGFDPSENIAELTRLAEVAPA